MIDTSDQHLGLNTKLVAIGKAMEHYVKILEYTTLTQYTGIL